MSKYSKTKRRQLDDGEIVAKGDYYLMSDGTKEMAAGFIGGPVGSDSIAWYRDEPVAEPVEELVAVMLPREDVGYYADDMPTEKSPDSRCNRLKSACKRAIRPEPPSRLVILDLLDDGAGTENCDAARWVEHVLEHGWEVE